MSGTLTATALPRHCASNTLPKPPCPCTQLLALQALISTKKITSSNVRVMGQYFGSNQRIPRHCDSLKPSPT